MKNTKNGFWFWRTVLSLGLGLGLCCVGSAFADTQTRTSLFEYDARGMLVREVVEPDRVNDCVATGYELDGLGNRVSTVVSGCAGVSGPARTSRSTYAAASGTVSIGGQSYKVTAGQYETGRSNALGHQESVEYDPRFGVVRRLTGPNGLSTSWEFDNFGRKVKEMRADGTYTTWTYAYCGSGAGAISCPGLAEKMVAVWVVTQADWAKDGSALSASRLQYVDAWGRVVREQSQDFYDRVVVQDTIYNALGQVVKKSQVYGLSGGQPNWSSFVYDALGRVLSETHPDPNANGGMASSSMVYQGLTQIQTNAKGQKKTTQQNVQGQVEQVIDEQGQSVNYSYDALGNLVETKAAGNTSTLSYDQRGRKVAMQDAAMGSWTYAYNVFGELVSQTDSLNQTTTMEYDRLGRLVKRTEPDLTSNWTYDTDETGAACGKSTGKLCVAQSNNGYRRVHKYDELGRQSQEGTTLDNPNALQTMQWAYDGNTGRLKSQVWPTGYTANYVYSKGYLISVQGAGPNMANAGISDISYDSQGRVVGYKQGNQVLTGKIYQDGTGRLLKQQAQLQNSPVGSVQNVNYTYDSLSNLTSRSDANTGVVENFSYDSLNRLSLYTVLGGGVSPANVIEVRYDARGNIAYKSDVGQYWYDSNRPNRMTNVTLSAPAGSQPLTGSRTLSYAFDDYQGGAKTINNQTFGNGNLMYTVSHDPKQGVHTLRWESYSSFNKPVQIQYSNIESANGNASAGAVIGATVNYRCDSGQQLNGSNCVWTQYVGQVVTGYQCAAGEQLNGSNCLGQRRVGVDPQTLCMSDSDGTFCWGRCLEGQFADGRTENGSGLCYKNLPYTVAAKEVLACPAGYSATPGSGATGTKACQKTQTQAAKFSFSCPGGYSVSADQCRFIGMTSTSASYSDRTLNYVYGPEHQRIKETVQLSGNGTSAYMSGATWYLNGANGQPSYEKEVRGNGVTEHRHYLSAGGLMFAVVMQRSGTGVTTTSTNQLAQKQVNYLHQDHLGSVAVITNESGQVIERLAYDPWGKRRKVNGQTDTTDSLTGQTMSRGYTLHEHLDEVGVIHMNGRVYDPLVGRMMSADPYIQAPNNLQSHNRYAYVWNRPLAMTDPSGYFGLGDVGDFISHVTQVTSDAMSTEDFKTAAVIAVVVVTAGAASSAGAPAGLAGMAGGFAGGFTAAAIHGANFSQAFFAGVEGGVQGFFAGLMFQAAGDGVTNGSYAKYGWGHYTAHAAAGCISSVAMNGQCGAGAATGWIGLGAEQGMSYYQIQSMAAKTAVIATVGGTASRLAGGDFRNGAITAAYGYLFNELCHQEGGPCRREPRIGEGKEYPNLKDSEEYRNKRQEMKTLAVQVADDVSTGAAYAAAICVSAVVCAPAAPGIAAVGVGASIGKDFIFGFNPKSFAIDTAIDKIVTDIIGNRFHVPQIITIHISEEMKNTSEVNSLRK